MSKAASSLLRAANRAGFFIDDADRKLLRDLVASGESVVKHCVALLHRIEQTGELDRATHLTASKSMESDVKPIGFVFGRTTRNQPSLTRLQVFSWQYPEFG